MSTTVLPAPTRSTNDRRLPRRATIFLVVIGTALTCAFVVGPRACCYLWPFAFAGVALVVAVVALWISWRTRESGLLSSSVVLVAFALSGLYWNLLEGPKWAVSDSLVTIIKYLDFGPAILGRLVLPAAWDSNFHAFFRDGTYCFPGPPWWEAMRYFRVGVATYTLVVGLPTFVFFRRHRGRAATSAPRSSG